MENLQELSNQIDNIKEKLTDKEYKDLMELTQKINDNKKKYVKCLCVKFKMLNYKVDDEDCDSEDEIEYIDKFDFTTYDHNGRLGIHIRKVIEVDEKIYEITNENPGMMVMGEYSMNKECYEHLKENKYENNDNSGILVYLCDMP